MAPSEATKKRGEAELEMTIFAVEKMKSTGIEGLEELIEGSL